MVDFHSHILPGIDDGSRSIEETEKLLLEAKEFGFDKVISTSHYALDCYECPEYKRKEMLNELIEDGKDGKYPELFLGSEIFLTFNIVDLLTEFKASTINGTNYILFELPLRGHFPNLKDIINKLKENNYRLILAHPERYSMVQKNFDILYELQEMGVIFQSNYGSILGIYGMQAKNTLKKMLKNGLVSLLGTDVHRQESIYPKTPKAIKKISKYISKEEFRNISRKNAEAILRGENI